MTATTLAPLTGPAVWLGRDIATSSRWRRRLTPAMTEEIDAALREAQRRGRGWAEIRREDFPLPTVSALLAEVADELEDGCGMMRLSGLPVERHSEEELRAIWFGLAAHLGRPVFQNAYGELMRAIRDEGGDLGTKYGQIADAGEDKKPFLSSYARTLSNGRLRFHTDRCDVVGLLCVRQARAGGESLLCSSPAVHNAMLERRPELAASLFEDVWRSRLGEEAGGDKVAYPLPVFGVRDGRFTSHYSLTYIEAAQLAPDVPKLTPRQREAIEMLMALAQELSFEMTLEPGDMQFLNNHVVYHGRTPFEDEASSGRDRLLLRLWLAMPNSRALPQGQEVLWRRIEPGALRGGIAQADSAREIVR
jgi:hypothetical protein